MSTDQTQGLLLTPVPASPADVAAVVPTDGNALESTSGDTGRREAIAAAGDTRDFEPVGVDRRAHPDIADDSTPRSTPGYGAYEFLAPPTGPDELGRLDGYRVLRVLGEGGMGIVFEAFDEKLERKVAIKVVRPGECDETAQKRFLQEARLAGSLSCEQIVTIYQVGQSRGVTYLVMELLTGETLEDRLASEGSLPLAEALRITREVAEGLSAAHDKHLIHRDIKPANVWLRAKRTSDPYCRVKLLDFGIARPVVVRDSLTTTGQIVGTPDYMSPEQACGLQLDERSDLFSLGCVLYAMLAGKPPFRRDGEMQSLQAVVFEQAVPIEQRVGNLPHQVVKLVEHLLNKQTNARPESARQVVDLIRRIERNTSGERSENVHPGQSVQSLGRVHRDKIGWGVWAGGLVLLAACALGGWTQYSRLSSNAAARDAIRPSAPKQPATPNPPVAAVAGDATAEESEAPAVPASNDLPPVKVGVLCSLSGPMAASERCVVDALLLAIDELNASGGVLGGRPIEAVVRDGKSNEFTFAHEAEDLITNEQVATLFGACRSPSRKLVEAVCRSHDHLLVNPATYEGLEHSPHVIYMGGAPNQQVLPAVKWAFAFLGRRKFFLIGADGIYSNAVHQMVKDELQSLGAEVVGEEFRRLEDMDYAPVAQKVKNSGADVVLNTVTGIGNAALFHSLREAGIQSADVPTISFKVTEEELRTFALQPEDVEGDYAALSYFETVDRPENHDFVQRFRDRFGPSRAVNDPMAAAYAGMYFWASAVDQAKSLEPAKIRAAFVDMNYEAAPEGTLAINPENQHALRMALIGQVQSNLDFDIVWTSPRPIEPEPFPSSRTPEEWEQFEQKLHHQWGGNWRPNPPRPTE